MLRWHGLREATSTVSLSWAPRTCIGLRWAVSGAGHEAGLEPLGDGPEGFFYYLVGQGVAGEVAGVHVDGEELPDVEDPVR
jgi:hypothetical protein